MGTCLNCNQSFETKANGRPKKYCSRSCEHKYKYQARRKLKPPEQKYLKEERKITLLICVECGAMYESRGGRSKYCNVFCKRKAEQKRRQIYINTCIQCNQPFETKNEATKFCSATCVGEFQRLEAIEKNYYSIPRHIFPNKGARREYRRRKRIRDNWVEDVKIEVLIDRDKSICQLCFEPVDLDVDYLHPLAPTNDHIIPVSLGGEHSYANCQLAHRKCNTKKNNRIEVEHDVKTKQKCEGTTSEITN